MGGEREKRGIPHAHCRYLSDLGSSKASPDDDRERGAAEQGRSQAGGQRPFAVDRESDPEDKEGTHGHTGRVRVDSGRYRVGDEERWPWSGTNDRPGAVFRDQAGPQSTGSGYDTAQGPSRRNTGDPGARENRGPPTPAGDFDLPPPTHPA